MKYKFIERVLTDKTKGVLCDQTIVITGPIINKKYPECLRRIRYYDVETANTSVSLTNNFKLSALTIVALNKNRWGIDFMFKWIKQHLKI